MADDNRYGGYGRGGRDDRDRDRGSYGSQGYGQSSYGQDRDRSWGGYDRDRDRDRGGLFGGRENRDRDRDRSYTGYSQGGSYGQQGSMGSSAPPPPQAYNRQGRDDDRFDNRDSQRDVAIDETDRLIASNKVEGTRVYNRRGDRLGTIYNFMVDKRSGRVEYAVMSFGGFLGMGERFYPLPWQVLTYDEQMGGYRINIDGDERELSRAPSFMRGEEPRFDRAYGQHVYGFYGLTY